MRQRDVRLLIGIIVVVVLAAWVVWPSNSGINIDLGPIHIHRNISVREGLDLRGGTRVLLEADVPADQQVTPDMMNAARAIVENRVNGLGVTEPSVQLVGQRRILVELPGISDPDQAVDTFKNTGLLEWIDAGSTYLQPGTVVKTDFGQSVAASSGNAATPTTAPTTGASGAVTTTSPVTGTNPLTSTNPVTGTAPVTTPTNQVFHTVLTGKDLKSASVGTDEVGAPEIQFELNPDGAKIFSDYTTNNVGKYLAIVMDKKVISCPRVNGPIPDGSGRITGQFPLAEAQSIVVQLKYGALPVPLKVIERESVGPTLGQDSVTRSLQAGVIGLIIVLLFMLIYYRLLGVLASAALLIYAMITFALFKLIPVTLTLPGITGFLLSVAMAVDANILIFERMKEELRHGKSMSASIEAGFSRAWTSIRDSNLSTIITCIILFWFGSTFGASTVKGFAITLFLGILISLFTAVVISRTFLRATFAYTGEKLREKQWLLGLK